jgi:hypothetical protein
MIDSIGIGDMELTALELFHMFNSIKIVREINPTTFFVENMRFEGTCWEVSLSLSGIAM